MVDVAIVGIGMHAFGRHEGITGMEQGAVAVRRAVANAGVEWKDMQFAFGGSRAAGDPDRMVSMLGLTGLQFINVTNGCATGGSALFSTIRSNQVSMILALLLGLTSTLVVHSRRLVLRLVGETGTVEVVWR